VNAANHKLKTENKLRKENSRIRKSIRSGKKVEMS